MLIKMTSVTDAKQQLFRSVVEAYSFFKELGDVKGLRVLDLACGNGHYTRQIYERGAKEVAGVDVSSEMIKLAKYCILRVGGAFDFTF